MPHSEPPSIGRHVLLAGGGSGGHVFPALAVGEALRARGWTVSFAGTAEGMEARLVPAHGVAFHPLAARPSLGRGPLGKLRSAGTLVASTFAGRSLVRRLEVDAVVGTGGYASAPAVLGARLAGRPAILVEPNIEAGEANRFLSRFATAAALAAPHAARRLHCPVEVTGVPVRLAFAEPPRPLPARRAVLVLGGSQGARSLNDLLPRAFALAAKELGDLAVVHQAGERFLDEARAAYAAHGVRATVVPFLDDIGAAMAAASLIVSRAGANTLAEIACARRPALLLPLAAAAGHQAENAAAVAAAGAAELVEPGTGAEALAATLIAWLRDPVRLERGADAAFSLARPRASDAVADLVERVVSEGRWSARRSEHSAGADRPPGSGR